MKTGRLTNVTSGLSIISLSLLLIVSFSVETSAKRGCSAFGHSCFGGHGKRSNSDDQTRLKEVEADSAGTNDVARGSGINDVFVNMDRNEIQQLRDFTKCRNCAVELSRRGRNDQNYIPLILRQLLVSYRRPYNIDLKPNDK